jgi:hypothetical protein
MGCAPTGLPTWVSPHGVPQWLSQNGCPRRGVPHGVPTTGVTKCFPQWGYPNGGLPNGVPQVLSENGFLLLASNTGSLKCCPLIGVRQKRSQKGGATREFYSGASPMGGPQLDSPIGVPKGHPKYGPTRVSPRGISQLWSPNGGLPMGSHKGVT